MSVFLLATDISLGRLTFNELSRKGLSHKKKLEIAKGYLIDGKEIILLMVKSFGICLRVTLADIF